MAKMVIKMISETEAQVTKAFAKNAVIFGTEEYKLWREYRKDFPDAKMVTKTIKKNPEKKTYRNLTYKNMELFISVQPKKEDENGNVIDYKKEFERQKLMSKVQSNPYKAVLAWFLATFENYSTYKTFFKELEENCHFASKFFFPYFAVMTAVPFFLAFTTPFEDTVATLFLLLVQVIFPFVPLAFKV